MKLQVRYDAEFQEIDVDLEEMEQWLNFNVEEGRSLEEREEAVQEEVNVQFNRPDYNNWHKLNRHWGMPKSYAKNLFEDDKGDTDGIRYLEDKEDARRTLEREERICVEEYIRKVFVKKPEWVDAAISIWIEGESIREYAARTGQDENNITQKLKRAKTKLKKYFSKPSDYIALYGY